MSSSVSESSQNEIPEDKLPGKTKTEFIFRSRSWTGIQQDEKSETKKQQVEDTSYCIEEGARAVNAEASEKNIIAIKKKVMIHKQQNMILDDLKKGEDAPEYPEFIKTKVIETKADGQEILCETGIQQVELM